MARRIDGAVLIIRALAPLIVFAAFAGSSVVAVREITGAAGRYGRRVAAQVDTARQTFTRASEGFAALATYVAAVKRAVDGVATDVRRLSSRVTVPVIDRSIRVPGVAEFKTVVSDLATAGRQVGTEVDKVTSLVTVPGQLREIQFATETFAADVESAVVRWIVVVLSVLALGLAVWAVSELARIVSDVRRGWALLRGV